MQTTFDIHTSPIKPILWAPVAACADSLEGENPRDGYVAALVERSMR